MTRRKKLFFIIPAAIAGMILFTALGGGVVRWLWNWLLPSLFGWRQLTFWQAVGILALCRILFGSHGFRGARSSARGRMKERMAERYASMTPEERENFRQNWRGGCGFGPPSGEGQGQ